MALNILGAGGAAFDGLIRPHPPNKASPGLVNSVSPPMITLQDAF